MAVARIRGRFSHERSLRMMPYLTENIFLYRSHHQFLNAGILLLGYVAHSVHRRAYYGGGDPGPRYIFSCKTPTQDTMPLTEDLVVYSFL